MIIPEHRGIYRLQSRNLLAGVYDAGTGRFLGIREKFGAAFLDSEWYERTAWPYEKLGQCPEDIPLAERENAPATCQACGKPCEWSGPTAPAPWLCESGCADVHPLGPPENRPLRAILDGYDHPEPRSWG